MNSRATYLRILAISKIGAVRYSQAEDNDKCGADEED